MIDAHLHVLDAERFDCPWLEALPLLRTPSAGVAEALVTPSPLSGSVVVEADVATSDLEAEARWLCALAEDPRHRILGVVASARPESDAFERQLERVCHPRLVGIRRVLHVVPDATSQTERFRASLRELSRWKLTFDLCVRADQLALAAALVESAPDTQFVLDHGGNPPLSNDQGMRSWQQDVARVAQLPNVVCKVSGLVNHASSGASITADVASAVAHLAETFGWGRMMFGSDWPVSMLAGFDRTAWLALALQLTRGIDAASREAFFSHNAERVYRLERPHA